MANNLQTAMKNTDWFQTIKKNRENRDKSEGRRNGSYIAFSEGSRGRSAHNGNKHFKVTKTGDFEVYTGDAQEAL